MLMTVNFTKKTKKKGMKELNLKTLASKISSKYCPCAFVALVFDGTPN